MQVLSVDEESDIKVYLLEDKGAKYIAEKLFSNKSPRSRLLVDIKKKITETISERRELIKHPSYIHYQDIEQINGESCLIREGTELYKPLNKCLNDSDLTLDNFVDWMLDLGQIALEIGGKGVVWQGITMDSIWVTKSGKLRFLDPDIANMLAKYRNTNDIEPIEIYQAPEMFKKKTWDEQSLIYSVGIIMYYLLTGEKPFQTRKKSDIDKSDLVHEIISTTPVEPFYINPRISPKLNDFIMHTLAKEKGNRVESWHSFIKQLEEIKKSGIRATKVEEEESRIRAEKVIKSSFRKKGIKNFWRKKRKAITITLSILVLLYIVSITGGSDPYITEETPAAKVVEYFYQAIDEKNTILLEESSIIDLKRLDSMVAEGHVIGKMRSAYNLEGTDEEGIFGIKDLSIVNISEGPQPTFQAEYIFYYNMAEQPGSTEEGNIQAAEGIKHYQSNMTDILELGNVEGIWRIVNIKGSLEYIIKGKTMEILK